MTNKKDNLEGRGRPKTRLPCNTNLKSLTPRHRLIFELRTKGKAFTEIGEQIGLSAVRTRFIYFQAIEILKRNNMIENGKPKWKLIEEMVAKEERIRKYKEEFKQKIEEMRNEAKQVKCSSPIVTHSV